MKQLKNHLNAHKNNFKFNIHNYKPQNIAAHTIQVINKKIDKSNYLKLFEFNSLNV